MIELEKLLPELKKRTLSPKQLLQRNNQIGLRGEQLAQIFLTNNAYTILATNISWKQFEIDILALTPDKNTLVFVEVKTKHTSFFGHPSEAYSSRKKKACQRIALYISRSSDWKKEIRFDIIAVVIHSKSIQHFTHVSW